MLRSVGEPAEGSLQSARLRAPLQPCVYSPCCLGGPVSRPSALPARARQRNPNPRILLSESLQNTLKLSTTDLLVLASMKNAAKCDK
jgi:hypothetical protein